MITVEFITALFYEVDEQLRTIPKHPCVLDTFFHLEGFGLYTQLGPHDTIHFGEVH